MIFVTGFGRNHREKEDVSLGAGARRPKRSKQAAQGLCWRRADQHHSSEPGYLGEKVTTMKQ